MSNPIPTGLLPGIASPVAAQNLPRQLKIIRATRKHQKTIRVMKKASPSFTKGFKAAI